MMWAQLKEFALTLHPEKTRLIGFGRHAAARREKRGEASPTFNCLGVTLICGKSRRDSSCHGGSRDVIGCRQGFWREAGHAGGGCISRSPGKRKAAGGVSGCSAYHAVPTNTRSIQILRDCVMRLWLHSLRRCGQRDKTTRERSSGWQTTSCRSPASLAQATLRRQTPKAGAVCGNAARMVLCGRAQWWRPYRDLLWQAPMR